MVRLASRWQSPNCRSERRNRVGSKRWRQSSGYVLSKCDGFAGQNEETSSEQEMNASTVHTLDLRNGPVEPNAQRDDSLPEPIPGGQRR
jgi:hypothetical protein